MPTELTAEELSSLTALLTSHGICQQRIITTPMELKDFQRDMGEPPRVFSHLLSSSMPQVLIQPQTPKELSVSIKLLHRRKIPFTPRGMGSTGLGGAVPVAGGAVVDLSRMSGIISVDKKTEEIKVLAGTTFHKIQTGLAKYGLELKSRPSNAFGTIGGWASGGGMGLGSLTAGPIMKQVRDVEVVYPDGSLELLTSSAKGFEDLFQTEGQLGIIASLTLQAQKCTHMPHAIALSASSVGSAMETVHALLKHSIPVNELTLLGRTEDHPALSVEPGRQLLLATWTSPPGSVHIPDSSVILPQELANHLWNRRFFPMDNDLGPIFLASEAIVPLDKVESLTRAARKRARRFGLPLLLHGHVVATQDTLEMLVLFMFPCDPEREWNHLMLAPLAAILTSIARRKGGRPYGIGIWNTPFAKKSFGPKRMKRLKEQKRILDPDNLCNPGKFFRVGTKAKTLPLVMSRGVYPSMLSIASGLGPVLKGRSYQDKHANPAFDRCVWCGACVTTCPAVAVTGSESVSARAKLSILKRIHQHEHVADEELASSMRCLACGQCQEVCARGLNLLDQWEDLERFARKQLDDESFKDCVTKFAALVDAKRDKAMGVALP